MHKKPFDLSILFHFPHGGRRYSVALLEFPVEIAGVRVPHFLSHVVSDIVQILGKGAAHFPLENLAQIGSIHMVFVGQRL